MKFVVVLFLLLSGCATSEYGQGCRDAVDNLYYGSYKDWHDEYCDKLEKKYKEQRLDLQILQHSQGK